MSSSFIRFSEVPLDSCEPNQLSLPENSSEALLDCMCIDRDLEEQKDSVIGVIRSGYGSSDALTSSPPELPVTCETVLSPLSSTSAIKMRDDNGGIVDWTSVTPTVTITVEPVSSDEDSDIGSTASSTNSSVFYENEYLTNKAIMAGGSYGEAASGIIDPQDPETTNSVVDQDPIIIISTDDLSAGSSCDSGDESGTTTAETVGAAEEISVSGRRKGISVSSNGGDSGVDSESSLLPTPHYKSAQRRRADSTTPSNSNLSDISETDELKVEDDRPKRRSTLADIFRWYGNFEFTICTYMWATHVVCICVP